MVIKDTPRVNPIHSGERTHSQDQLIYPVSFNPINRMVNIPAKPIPPVFLPSFDILLGFRHSL
jgi:hypothetical protein